MRSLVNTLNVTHIMALLVIVTCKYGLKPSKLHKVPRKRGQFAVLLPEEHSKNGNQLDLVGRFCRDDLSETDSEVIRNFSKVIMPSLKIDAK